MNNVCLAGQVAVLFRRLVHVVSTVSVAQQYHFYKRNRSTAEHTSSQPTVEHQYLLLEQTLPNADHSLAIPSVLAERWSRLRDGGFGELWRSSLMSDRPRPQLNFGAHPPFARLPVLLTLLQMHWDYCHGSGRRGLIQPNPLRSAHPIKFHIHALAQLWDLSHRIRDPSLLSRGFRKGQETIPSRN